jgi:hypothetical protein
VIENCLLLQLQLGEPGERELAADFPQQHTSVSHHSSTYAPGARW